MDLNPESKFAADVVSLLECSICKDVYNIPKMLDCGHSFCLTCLESYCGKSTAIVCPVCRGKTYLSAKRSLSQLKTNFILRDLIDLHNKHQREDVNKKIVKVCVWCSAAEEKATKKRKKEYFCNNCSAAICISCATKHSMLTTHRVIEYQRNHKKGKVALNFPMCWKHPNSPLTGYCCDELICDDCHVIAHNPHDSIPIDDAKVLFQSEIHNKIAQLSELSSSFEIHIMRFNDRIFDLIMTKTTRKYPWHNSYIYETMKAIINDYYSTCTCSIKPTINISNSINQDIFILIEKAKALDTVIWQLNREIAIMTVVLLTDNIVQMWCLHRKLKSDTCVFNNTDISEMNYRLNSFFSMGEIIIKREEMSREEKRSENTWLQTFKKETTMLERKSHENEK